MTRRCVFLSLTNTPLRVIVPIERKRRGHQMTTYTIYAVAFDWPAVFEFTVDAPYSVDALAAAHVEMAAAGYAGYADKAGYILALAEPQAAHRTEQFAELTALAREKAAA